MTMEICAEEWLRGTDLTTTTNDDRVSIADVITAELMAKKRPIPGMTHKRRKWRWADLARAIHTSGSALSSAKAGNRPWGFNTLRKIEIELQLKDGKLIAMREVK